MPRVTVPQQWPAKISGPGLGNSQTLGDGEGPLVWVGTVSGLQSRWGLEVGRGERGQWQDTGWAVVGKRVEDEF